MSNHLSSPFNSKKNNLSRRGKFKAPVKSSRGTRKGKSKDIQTDPLISSETGLSSGKSAFPGSEYRKIMPSVLSRRSNAAPLSPERIVTSYLFSDAMDILPTNERFHPHSFPQEKTFAPSEQSLSNSNCASSTLKGSVIEFPPKTAYLIRRLLQEFEEATIVADLKKLVVVREKIKDFS
jgi:hypothetical protein